MRKATFAVGGLLLLGAAVAIGWFAARRATPPSEFAPPEKSVVGLTAAQSLPDLEDRSGTLSRDAPHPVYAPDADDPWNRIFYCLFTRAVQARLSQEFQKGAPLNLAQGTGVPQLPVRQRPFERIESGDRAIEPLYPSFLSAQGPFQVLAEPRYSQLKGALLDALGLEHQRSPLARALMQSDVWAAYDVLARDYRFAGDEAQLHRERRDQLRSLLAQFLKKLVLTPDEIEALPNTFAAAASAHALPDLFASASEWMEVRWLPERLHDQAADYRRVARVFIKPASLPSDRARFLNGLRRANNLTMQLDAVALVIQNLVIDGKGKVVPSRLTYEVQFRQFLRDAQGQFEKTELRQYELSRKLLLSDPKSGGLTARSEVAPSYLPEAGNDYGFASTHRGRGGASEPVLVSLRTRCNFCHAPHAATVQTFALHDATPLPLVAQMKPSADDQARYVAERKRAREDFKALEKQWGTERH
jgi:hypothetical protein